MKSMIVVACLALACGTHASGWAGPPANIALSQDGRNILDTPEVAQARAAHIAALQKASQNNPNPQDDGSYDPRWDNEEYWQGAEQRSWNGAPAASSWNGATAASSWNGAAAGSSWNGAPSHQWNAAPVAPAWNAAGAAPAPVAETPEVAQARAAHLAALAAAKPAGPAPQQWNAPRSSTVERPRSPTVERPRFPVERCSLMARSRRSDQACSERQWYPGDP
ncbi:unnamed protein product [Parnassius apollo]|uniref:(apollo) hypothetical protein n=1 Tax=Parnassius apollo TaxID=110799 RepID=A0A8S3Y0B7_PARAO|nr:unnamed protein product [Parnassius apollo]